MKTFFYSFGALFIWIPLVAGAAEGHLSCEAERLLLRLNNEIVKHRNDDPKSSDFGAVWCPGCGLCHTRAAEALFPLAYEFRLTGNKQRIRQAIDLGNWLIAQQQPGGEWKETPEEWTGTTTDQLLMMLLAYPILEPHLKKPERAEWLRSMENAADYLSEVMDNRFASINYCATTTATLAEAHRLIPKQKYAAKARELAHMIVAKMNGEYFIEGEGSREGAYKYGVDLGYNLEMSLWGLARYAKLTGDVFVAEAVARSTANHLWFIYPDGTLDGSSGIRSNKWTIFGSGTSDGCHPLFALLSDRDPAYISAAVRNIGQIERSFTACGLLGQGPHYDLVRAEPPCIYPTFTKAKSMAMAIDWMARDNDASAPIPTDRNGYRFFPSLNVAVVRTPAFCGTVTAYNYKAKEGAKSKYMHRPTGGTLSALWVDGFGLLTASSQTEYHRWEPMSFPEMPCVEPLTPHIGVVLPEGFHTNLYEYDATFAVDERDGVVETTAYGRLKNRDQRPCGVAYRLTHSFGGDKLKKSFEIRHQTVAETVRIVEPIVWDEDTELVQVDPRTIRITRAGRTATLSLQGDGMMRIASELANHYWNIYPAIRTMPVVVDMPPNEMHVSNLTLTFTAER